MREVADRRGPSLSHELRVGRVHEVIVREAAAAATAVIGQQAGRTQAVAVHGRKLGFVAVATGLVLQGERAGVELQRAGERAGLEGRLDGQGSSRGAFSGLMAEVGAFVEPLLL